MDQARTQYFDRHPERVRVRVRKALQRRPYSLGEEFEHACEIALLTRGRSGFYGVPFPALLPVMDQMVQEEA